jgi:FkbM family methyltransferase|tara:strand:+ start:1207 stop:2088 length:882 start_codon:yes stop_codon:yes gene_type:complete
MTRLPYLVNVPPFLIRDLNQKNLSLSKKIFLIFYGKFIGFFINRLNGKNFCLFINIFFNKDGKLIFENGRYVKIIENKNVAVYPNKRVLRVVKNFKYQLDLLYDSYLLNSIDIQNDDVIVDCGANVGELFLAVKEKNLDVTYMGFEPDKETYECLKLNVKNEKNIVHNIGLSNIEGSNNFYIDNEGGNSSFVDFGTSESIKVDTKTLDSYNIKKNIKLFKIDAEGYEPEVLSGSKNTLKKTNFVSVDFGSERGANQNNTMVDVNNLLLQVGFELIELNDFRMIGLYKNKNYEN